jgi:serine protease Do
VRLAREGQHTWSVREGTAKIRITYNAENFFIAGDAYLCQMPADATKIKPLYQFLMEENYRTKGLVLSCMKQNIVLSCIMYDLDLTRENGTAAFRNPFSKADYYDDFLKTEYSCVERLEE